MAILLKTLDFQIICSYLAVYLSILQCGVYNTIPVLFVSASILIYRKHNKSSCIDVKPMRHFRSNKLYATIFRYQEDNIQNSLDRDYLLINNNIWTGSRYEHGYGEYGCPIRLSKYQTVYDSNLWPIAGC